MSVELLAPAGDLQKLKIAVMYGANAVFIGGEKFSLRSRASNFTLEDIKEGCDFAHQHGAHIHVTCNILPHETDLEGLIEYLKKLEKCGVDAIICASPIVIEAVIKHTKMECHVSTQESTLNSKMVDFWTNLGVTRVVLGRELSIPQIKEIKAKSNVQIEAFIHGGMCVSYSGRCMLSNNMTNRDANRGGCAHSCRWNYDLLIDNEKINPDGEYFQMSSKDLCSIYDIKGILDSYVDSLKIEGRMKSIHYIATVVKCYRMMIDEYEKTGDIKDYDYYMNFLKKAENRLTSYGFLRGMTDISEQLYNSRSENPTQDFVGIVLDYDKKTQMAKIEVRNFFLPHSKLEVFGPHMKEEIIQIEDCYNEDGDILDACRHPKDIIYFKTSLLLSPYDLIRTVDEI